MQKSKNEILNLREGLKQFSDMAKLTRETTMTFFSSALKEGTFFADFREAGKLFHNIALLKLTGFIPYLMVRAGGSINLLESRKAILIVFIGKTIHDVRIHRGHRFKNFKHKMLKVHHMNGRNIVFPHYFVNRQVIIVENSLDATLLYLG